MKFSKPTKDLIKDLYKSLNYISEQNIQGEVPQEEQDPSISLSKFFKTYPEAVKAALFVAAQTALGLKNLKTADDETPTEKELTERKAKIAYQLSGSPDFLANVPLEKISDVDQSRFRLLCTPADGYIADTKIRIARCIANDLQIYFAIPPIQRPQQKIPTKKPSKTKV